MYLYSILGRQDTRISSQSNEEGGREMRREAYMMEPGRVTDIVIYVPTYVWRYIGM